VIGSPGKVAVSRPIAAPAEKVWELISTPGNLLLCHPFCKANPVSRWPGPDARDEVHYLSGWIYERRFQQWHEGEGYDLEVGRPGGGQSFVSWRITSTDENNCVLKITVTPQTPKNIPVIFRWFTYQYRIRPLLSAYLTSVVRGVDWYVTMGERITWNQFGAHPWFSE
jgi:hypothetical protein